MAKISMASQDERTAVHFAREVDACAEDARTLCCGLAINKNRIYPLYWSESMRLVTCRRKPRAGRK